MRQAGYQNPLSIQYPSLQTSKPTETPPGLALAPYNCYFSLYLHLSSHASHHVGRSRSSLAIVRISTKTPHISCDLGTRPEYAKHQRQRQMIQRQGADQSMAYQVTKRTNCMSPTTANYRTVQLVCGWKSSRSRNNNPHKPPPPHEVSKLIPTKDYFIIIKLKTISNSIIPSLLLLHPSTRIVCSALHCSTTTNNELIFILLLQFDSGKNCYKTLQQKVEEKCKDHNLPLWSLQYKFILSMVLRSISTQRSLAPKIPFNFSPIIHPIPISKSSTVPVLFVTYAGWSDWIGCVSPCL